MGEQDVSGPNDFEVLPGGVLLDCIVPAMASVVHPGRRKAVEIACTHRLFVSVASVRAGQAPEAVELSSDKSPVVRLRIWNGRLWRRATGHLDGRTFGSISSHNLRAMMLGEMVDAANPICLPAEQTPLVGPFKSVLDDGTAAAQKWIDDRTGAMLFVDDELHVPSPVPEIRFSLPPPVHRSQEMSFTSGLVANHRITTTPHTPQGAFVVGIPAASSVAVDRFASSFEQRTGRTIERSGARATFLLDDPILHPDLVERDIRNIVGSIGTHPGLMDLPDAAFEGWMRVRTAHDVGDTGATVRELAAMALATPPEAKWFAVLAIACTAIELRAKCETPSADLLEAVEMIDVFDWGTK